MRYKELLEAKRQIWTSTLLSRNPHGLTKTIKIEQVDDHLDVHIYDN